MFSDTDEPLGRLPTALIAFTGIHLLMTIFMILKRVRAMFRSFRIKHTETVP
ncbi:hypothetical protein EDD30_2625 [Couchioplanes caeruleus]|uniref:Uncharacterized protein n=1 Tax=Couchioplanes caeruleus TaxID=56438 RepID=A0A3N1GHW5_9ACTN|nr:hypothetical protein EDD30_2625 [Couchioplanes caeruleus]